MPNRRKRVLIIDFSGYGVMTHVLSFLDHADHDAWEYIVIHASDDLRPGVDTYRTELADRKIVSYSVPVRQTISPRDVIAIARTLRLVRKIKPDLIHCHSTKAGFVGRICATLGRIPSVFTPHSFSFQMAETGSRTYRLLLAIEKALGRKTRRIAPVSETELALAVDNGICRKDKAVLIRNGVHMQQSDRAIAAAKTIRTELRIPADHVMVCFIGRFAPQKMPELVVETARALGELRHASTFLFLGNGPMEEQIQDLISAYGLQARCRWLGWQPYDKALAYLAASDTMLLPSRYEGLPYVALEAQAVGTVPVLTAVPGSSDAVIPDVTAITVPFGDVDAMASAIVKLSDPDLRNRMAASGREFVSSQFSAANMARQIESMYASVLAVPGKPDNKVFDKTIPVSAYDKRGTSKASQP